MFTFDETFWSTFALTVVNLLVLFIVLKLLLFKPVTKFIDNRNNKIEEAINSANALKEEVENMRQEYADKLKGAGEEGKKIIEEQRAIALAEYNDTLNTAKNDAKTIIDSARKEIEVEKEKALASLKKEVGGLVISASEKVIKKNMDSETNKKIISDFLEDSGVA